MSQASTEADSGLLSSVLRGSGQLKLSLSLALEEPRGKDGVMRLLLYKSRAKAFL